MDVPICRADETVGGRLRMSAPIGEPRKTDGDSTSDRLGWSEVALTADKEDRIEAGGFPMTYVGALEIDNRFRLRVYNFHNWQPVFPLK